MPGIITILRYRSKAACYRCSASGVTYAMKKLTVYIRVDVYVHLPLGFLSYTLFRYSVKKTKNHWSKPRYQLLASNKHTWRRCPHFHSGHQNCRYSNGHRSASVQTSLLVVNHTTAEGISYILSYLLRRYEVRLDAYYEGVPRCSYRERQFALTTSLFPALCDSSQVSCPKFLVPSPLSSAVVLCCFIP